MRKEEISAVHIEVCCFARSFVRVGCCYGTDDSRNEIEKLTGNVHNSISFLQFAVAFFAFVSWQVVSLTSTHQLM